MSSSRSAEDLTRETAKGLRWVSVSRLATEILLLGSMVALARLIRPAAFGQFTIAVIVQELAMGIPAEGVGSSLVQRSEVSREHLQAGAGLTLLIALLLSAITLLLASVLISPVFGAPTASLVRLSTPLFLLAGLSAVPVALLRRRLDFRRLAQIEIASSIVRSGTSLGLAALVGLQGSALVFGGLAAGAIGTALAYASAPSPLPRLRRSAIRDLSGYSLPASLASICWAGFRNGDYAVLNAKLGAVAAGQYWRAYTLAVDYQRKVTVVMYTMGFPVLARSRNQDDLFALRRRMVGLLTVVMFPLLTGLAITAPTLMPWLFGAAWRPAIVPTQILCLGGAFTLVIDAVGTALMAAGRARAMLNYGMAHFVMYVGSVIIVAHLGLAAVAIDAAVVHGLYLVIAYGVMVRGGLRPALGGLWGDVGPAATACVAMVAAMLPVDLLAASTHLAPPLKLLSVGAVGVLAYAVALRARFPRAWADLLTLAANLGPADGLKLRLTVGHKKLRALFVGRPT